MRRNCLVWLVALSPVLGGCTSMSEWWQNGGKVGPNYHRPPAPIADEWIDAGDPSVETDVAKFGNWWEVFNDPTLTTLVHQAHRQNLPLRVAGLRVLEARSARGVAAGNLFPQSQQMSTQYERSQTSQGFWLPFPMPARSDWTTGFNASWELDFWGRFRRAVEAADADLDASIEDYDAVLVMLLADVAAAYIEIRTYQLRIEYARQNEAVQQETLRLATARFEAGERAELDMQQAKASLMSTRAAIPTLETGLRQASNRLCILLGTPPRDLQEVLGNPGRVPTTPDSVVVGIPAELMRRRPDVRRAERLVAGQSARIGLATADLYPHFVVNGSIHLQAPDISQVFTHRSMGGSIGPSFQWDILNYGRLLNNINIQDARFKQAVVEYQNTVLLANQEVEDALVAFLRSKQRVEILSQGVAAAKRAVDLAKDLREHGEKGSLDRELLRQEALVMQQDQLAQTEGAVALNLIAAYKAIGGGWEIRFGPYRGPDADTPPPDVELQPDEAVPPPDMP